MESYLSAIIFLIGILIAACLSFLFLCREKRNSGVSISRGRPVSGFHDKRLGAVPFLVWVAIALSILFLAGAKSFELVTSPFLQTFTGTSGLCIATIVVSIIWGAIYYKIRQEK